MAQTLKEIIREEYKKCLADPVYFMMKYCVIQHPSKGKIPFRLYPFQKDVLRDLRDKRLNIILKSRQMGISTLTSGYSLWLMTFYSDKNILVIADTHKKAINLVTKVKVMYDGLPSWLKPEAVDKNKLTLSFTNGSKIQAVSSNPDSARSEGLSLLIIDEAAFIDNAEDLWTAAQQTLRTGGSGIILSTPNGTGNFFHKIWVAAENKENNFNPIRLPWHLHPELDQKWRNEQDIDIGPKKAAQECDCDFMSSGNTVIEPELIQWYSTTHVKEPIEKRGTDSSLWIFERPDYTRQYVVAADVARGDGNDYSAFHILDVESMTQVAEFKGQISTTDYANLLINIATEYNDALLVVENASIGWATIQVIIERGYKNLYYSPRDSSLPDLNRQLSKYVDLKSNSDLIPGFSTTSKTRPLMISKLDTYMRERAPVIRSKRMIDELMVFIWNGSKAEAQRGYNDDLVMSFCIALWIRDTALKLRAQGLEVDRKTLTYIGTGFSRPTDVNFNSSWDMPIKSNQTEDLRWLI